MIYVHDLLCRRIAHLLRGLGISFDQEGSVFYFNIFPDEQFVFSQLPCAVDVQGDHFRFAVEYPVKARFADEGQYWEFEEFFDGIFHCNEYGNFTFNEETHRIQYVVGCDCSRCLPSAGVLQECIGLGIAQMDRWSDSIQALLQGTPAKALRESLPEELLQRRECFGQRVDALDYEGRGIGCLISRFWFRLAAGAENLLEKHRRLSFVVCTLERGLALCGFLVAILLCGAMVADQFLKMFCANWNVSFAVQEPLDRFLSAIPPSLRVWLLIWGGLGVFSTVQFGANMWWDLCEDEAHTAFRDLFIKSLIVFIKLCFVLFCGAAALHAVMLLPFDPLAANLCAVIFFGELFLESMLVLSIAFRESQGTPWRWAFLGTLHFAAAIGATVLPVLF